MDSAHDMRLEAVSLSLEREPLSCVDMQHAVVELDSDDLHRLYSSYLVREGFGLAPSPKSPYYEFAKRLFDIVVSLTALLLLAPLFVLISLIIFLEDRGPVLYRQRRVGRDGRCFYFWKFRSMVIHAEKLRAEILHQNEAIGPVFKMQQDPRTTKVGRILRRTSLDELPQFLNVLVGSMSLVGPRPNLPREVAHYDGELWLRLSVKPGLMCYREVKGRSRLSFDEWMALDLQYLRDRSFAVDCGILVRGVKAVLTGDGAY